MKKPKFPVIVVLALILLLACSLAGSLKVANAVEPPSYHRNVSVAYNGGGQVQNWGNIQGESDGNYATMTTTYYGDTAIIKGEMNDWAIGEIYVRCCKYAGSESGMMVYTSDDSIDGPWDHVGNIRIQSDSLVWEPITDVSEPGMTPPPGYAPTKFKYIALCCYSPSSTDHNYVRVDAVAANPFVLPSFPPGYYPLTVNIRDNLGNPLAGEIYLNGYIIGYTSTTINVAPGQYELFVSVFDTENYVFQNYTAGTGEYTTNNPTPIYVTMPATVTAYFGSTSPPPPPPPPPTQYSLTVLATNQYSEPGYVPLYIDGQYVGTTGYTYTVTEGTHTIEVQSPLTDYYTYYHEFQYYIYYGYHIPDNPWTLSVTTDRTITAYYYSQYAY